VQAPSTRSVHSQAKLVARHVASVSSVVVVVVVNTVVDVSIVVVDVASVSVLTVVVVVVVVVVDVSVSVCQNIHISAAGSPLGRKNGAIYLAWQSSNCRHDSDLNIQT
jgi:hypothetical protein